MKGDGRVFCISFSINQDLLFQDRECSVGEGIDVSVDVERVREQCTLVDGFRQLELSIHSRDCPSESNLMVYVTFPSGIQHYLGPLKEDPVHSFRLVRSIPSSLTLWICEDSCVPAGSGAPSPAEMLLKEHVKIILDSDEYGGSIALDHLQNLVRDFPFYHEGIIRFQNWSKFVFHFEKYYRTWSVFLYDDALHSALGFSSHTPANDLRIVSHRNSRNCIIGDLRRDYCKQAALSEFAELLFVMFGGSYGVVKEGKCYANISRDGLQALSHSRSFQTLNNVNYYNYLKHQSSNGWTMLSSACHPVFLYRSKKEKKCK